MLDPIFNHFTRNHDLCGQPGITKEKRIHFIKKNICTYCMYKNAFLICHKIKIDATASLSRQYFCTKKGNFQVSWALLRPHFWLSLSITVITSMTQSPKDY